MQDNFRMLQLNVRKQKLVQQSVMNDEQLKEFGILVISEPYVRNIEGTVIISPQEHCNWTRMILLAQREGMWLIRSMMWI
jgi:hypothetical protein